jgi:hypothetical protein
MKTRNGFVSNSSSSSFVLLITPKAQKFALNKLKDWEQAHIREMFENLSDEHNISLAGEEFIKLTCINNGDQHGAPRFSGQASGKMTVEKNPESFHHKRCSLGDKTLDSTYCPECGAPQDRSYYTETPYEAWTNYLSILHELTEHPLLQEELFIKMMRG